MTTYLGIEVLERRPNAREAQLDTSRRLRVDLDPGLGARAVRSRDEAPAIDRPYLWTCTSKASAAELKAWFAVHQGRLVPCWIPTGRRDLLLAQPASAGASTLAIAACGYTRCAFPQKARRHLAIQMPSGVWAYRQVVDSLDGLDGPAETLSLSVALDEDLPIGAWMSYLTYCRLASDDLELQWITDEVAEAKLHFVEIPEEAP